MSGYNFGGRIKGSYTIHYKMPSQNLHLLLSDGSFPDQSLGMCISTALQKRKTLTNLKSNHKQSEQNQNCFLRVTRFMLFSLDEKTMVLNFAMKTLCRRKPARKSVCETSQAECGSIHFEGHLEGTLSFLTWSPPH